MSSDDRLHCISTVFINYYITDVAPIQGGGGIPVWLPYNYHMVTIQLLCGSCTAHIWLPYRVVGAFPSGYHTAPLWLPYRAVRVFLCGYHAAPMWVLYSSCVAPIEFICSSPAIPYVEGMSHNSDILHSLINSSPCFLTSLDVDYHLDL